MAQTIQLRGGTAAAWTSANPILAQREMGVETDTQLYKIGNGVDNWNTLPYNGLQPTLGVVTLSEETNPSNPSEGFLRLWASYTGGRLLPKIVGPSGLDTFLQTSLFGNGIVMYVPGSTTTPIAWGGPALTNVGTVSHPTLTSTNLRTSTSRWIYTSAATANAASEGRMAFARVWRGDQAGLGGFYHRSRFATSSTTANQQCFVGFTSSTAAIATTQVPSALTNMIGVGWDAANTTLQIMHNDGAGTATKVNLGANFPSNDTTAVYELNLFAAPNDTKITWSVHRLDTGNFTTGTITTDLPTSTTFLAYHAYMNNGGTAAAVVLELMRVYIETDY